MPHSTRPTSRRQLLAARALCGAALAACAWACIAGVADSPDAVAMARTAIAAVQAPVQSPTTDCDWLRSADQLALELWFESGDSAPTSDGGRQLRGLLKRQQNSVSATNPHGTWLSESASLRGSGAAPVSTPDKPGSAVVLRVDFDSCTYSVGASLWAARLVSTSRTMAVFSATALPLQQPGVVAGAARALAVRSVNDGSQGSAGYTPAGNDDTWLSAPPAWVRWRLVGTQS